MAKERMPVEKVRELFWYNKATGELIWQISPKWGVKIGDRAGSVHTDEKGYKSRQIGYQRRIYPASHLIWAWMKGEWPKDTIDHRNNDATDDRWENLRSATQAEQMRNTRTFRTNSTGYKGVTRYVDPRTRDGKHYRWQIMVDGKRYKSPDRFMTAEEAYADYLQNQFRFHGEFANKGA